MDIKRRFGTKVRQLREEKGISQERLAGLADIDRTYMSSIERGERNVSILVAEKLAKALKIKLKDLFDF